MDDNQDEFPALLVALENAQAGTFVSVDVMRALVRELHRLSQEYAELRRRLEDMERHVRFMPSGFRAGS